MRANQPRNLVEEKVERIISSYEQREEGEFLSLLLSEEIFPIKDSYVSYLKRDNEAIEKNPETVKRLTEILFGLTIDEIIERLQAPKETNRQIGPMFKNWCLSVGWPTTSNREEFKNSTGICIFDGSDEEMKQFAESELGYNHDKGLDFVGKVNSTFVIGEAKFLSDYGGHQNAQLNDAISTIQSPLEITDKRVIKIAILDGVIYIKGKSKMHRTLNNTYEDDQIILSATLLDKFLNSLLEL
jgi:hypothetical protein